MRTIGLPGLLALMIVESFGIPPLPSEVILPFAGVLMVEGAYGFNWVTVVLAALAGSLIGAFIAYEVGRYGGRAILRRWGKKFYINEAELGRAEEFFDRHGEATVFVARLIPLARAYISYPAGAAEMDRGKFVLFTALGALPFIVVMVYLGTLLGDNYTTLSHYFTYLDILVGVVIVVAIVWLLLRIRARERVPASPAP